MDASRWERLQALFHEALTRPEHERAAYLEREAGGEPDLLADVQAMLVEDARTGSHAESGDAALLDHDLGTLAHGVLDGPAPLLRTIGPYRVLGVLGRGGMGVVYLAERDDLGRRVAIKVLRDATLSPARRERFEREEQTLAALTHPAIARLYNADVLPDGTPYFVMEAVEGSPITDYCDTHDLPLRERLRLFCTVCEAVQHAHQRAVIHRDLKPSNVFVTTDDAGNPTPKLLDFGIAKPLDTLDAPVAQTQTGLRLMTPAYAAPEQLRGEAVGTYTDVYALGVVLYELVTGRYPFALNGLSAADTERVLLEHTPERPSAVAARRSELSPDAWADLDVLCLTAMHKDPTRRYATFDALLRDLDHFRAGKPLDARPDSFGYRAGKFVRRHHQPLTAAAAVLAVVVGLVAFYTARLTEQRSRAEAEAAKAEQVGAYLISLFEAGDPFAPGADSVSVQAVLRHGADEAEQLSGQPTVQAQMFDVLGRVHTVRSEYGRADTLLRRALALRRSAGDSLGAAETLANLGILHSESGAYDQAEAALRAALAVRERHLPPGHPDLALTLDALGTTLNRKGDYEEASALYQLALRIQRAYYDGPHEDLAATLNDIAVNLFDMGDYEAAESYYRQSIAMGRALFGPDHPSTAIDLANLGVLLDTRGDYEAADSVLTEALRIKRLHLGSDHYETAFTLTQLGGMLRRKGDLDRAEALLREALAIEGRVLPEGHRNTAVTLNHLALTLQNRGDYDAAEPLFERMIAIFGESLGEDHPYTAIGTCHLAHLHFLRGDAERADALYRPCLATLEAALPPGHDVVAMSESKYGEVLVAQSRFDEAEPLLLRGHEQLTEHFGPDHPDTQKAARRLVALYEAWDKPDEAGRFRAGANNSETAAAE
jgi:serine/threonine-protein kinase